MFTSVEIRLPETLHTLTSAEHVCETVTSVRDSLALRKDSGKDLDFSKLFFFICKMGISVRGQSWSGLGVKLWSGWSELVVEIKGQSWL